MIWEVDLVNVNDQRFCRLLATATALQIKRGRRGPKGRLRTTVIPRGQCMAADPYAEYEHRVAALRQEGYAVVREHNRPAPNPEQGTHNHNRPGWPPCTAEPPAWFF